MRRSFAQKAFSLAELLITLALVGVLAVFTIPALLNTPNSSLSSKQTAMAKDTAFMILSAYEQYKLVNISIASGTKPSALIPYLNYVSISTSGTVDAHPSWEGESGNGRNTCTGSTPCLKLHNGGTLYLYDAAFDCTNSLCLIEFLFDPDATTSGNENDSGTKSLQFELYYDGTIKTRGATKSGSCNGGFCGELEPYAPFNPSWFTGF